MMNGKTMPKPSAGSVPHKGTMSSGGGKGHKGTMGSGSSKRSISGTMGKHQRTGSGA